MPQNSKDLPSVLVGGLIAVTLDAGTERIPRRRRHLDTGLSVALLHCDVGSCCLLRSQPQA
jgi:hypothetical protein